MLNEHDVEDWKNTFNLPTASNHAGWVVQEFIKGIGWQDIEGPYVLKATAEAIVKLFYSRDKEHEFRVYESLS